MWGCGVGRLGDEHNFSYIPIYPHMTNLKWEQDNFQGQGGELGEGGGEGGEGIDSS